MKRTFCGKDCDACGYREQIQCPGCLSEPTDGLDMECAVARCCRFRQLESCADCEKIVGCDTLTRCDRTAEQKVKKWEAEEAKRSVVREKAPILGKWLRILFWLRLVVLVLGWIDGISFITYAICAVNILMLLPLWKLSGTVRRYRTVYLCNLMGTIVLPIVFMIPVASGGYIGLGVLVIAVLAVVAMIAVYQEFKAHAELLKNWDEPLSERWSQLWKWYVIVMVAAGVSGGLGVIPGLAGVSSAAVTLIPLVVSVLRIIYLHKTASCFETLGKNEAKPIE